MNMLLEIAYVLEYSKRTQFFLVMAVLAPLLFLLVGAHMVDQVVFSGPLESFGDLIREKLLRRYDKGALLVFVMMIGAAITSYRKARKRLL